MWSPSGNSHSRSGRLWTGYLLSGLQGKSPVWASRPLALTRATMLRDADHQLVVRGGRGATPSASSIARSISARGVPWNRSGWRASMASSRPSRSASQPSARSADGEPAGPDDAGALDGLADPEVLAVDRWIRSLGLGRTRSDAEDEYDHPPSTHPEILRHRSNSARGGAQPRTAARMERACARRREARRVADRGVGDGVLRDDVEHALVESEAAQRRVAGRRPRTAGGSPRWRRPAAVASSSVGDATLSATPTSASSRSRMPR